MWHFKTAYAGLTPPPKQNHVMWAIALFIGTTIGAAGGAFSLGYLAKHTGMPATDFISVGGLLGAVIAGGIVFFTGFVRKSAWGWSELGFSRPRHSLWHLLWWLPLTIIAGGIGAMMIGTSQGLSPTDPDAHSAGFHLGIIARIIILFGTVVIIPLFEEVVFRRVLLDWINTVAPMCLAAGIVTILFTVVHISPVIMAYVFFLGLSLVLARLWFQSLWGSFLIHASNNLIVTLVAISTL